MLVSDAEPSPWPVRLLSCAVAIRLEAWSSRRHEEHPIVAALGFVAEPTAAHHPDPDAADGRKAGAVTLLEAWAEDFSAVLTNAFDTMLLVDGNSQLLAYGPG